MNIILTLIINEFHLHSFAKIQFLFDIIGICKAFYFVYYIKISNYIFYIVF